MTSSTPNDSSVKSTTRISPAPQTRVGISDVAKTAGVSIGTVSNYLNYPDRVSDNLKFKIQSAIESLGYVRNQKRRAPSTPLASPVIGYVITDIENSLFTAIFEGIQEICDANDMEVLGVNALSDKSRQTDLVRMLCQMNVSGIIISSVLDSQDDMAFARAAGIPAVMVDHANPVLSNDHCTILKNDRAAGQIAVHELVNTGCTHLAYVAHSFEGFQAIKNRLEGTQEAANELNAHLDVIDSGGIMVEDGYDIGTHLANLPPTERPDGIIAGTDFLATGIISSAIDHGIDIPEEMSVIGLEGDKMESIGALPLSVVSSPGIDMGRQAMLQLADEISNPDTHIHNTQLLMPTLERRASSRKPKTTQKTTE